MNGWVLLALRGLVSPRRIYYLTAACAQQTAGSFRQEQIFRVSFFPNWPLGSPSLRWVCSFFQAFTIGSFTEKRESRSVYFSLAFTAKGIIAHMVLLIFDCQRRQGYTWFPELIGVQFTWIARFVPSMLSFYPKQDFGKESSLV